MSSSALIRPTGPVAEYNYTEPWQRQPCDDDIAWAAFRLWLTGPIPRSTLWVASRSDGVRTSQLEAWRKMYGWDARAYAFDNYCHSRFHQVVTAVLEERAEDYTQRHIDILTKATRLVANELDKFLVASEATTGLGVLTARELITLLDNSIKLERLVRGESTDRVHNEIDLSRFEPGDLLTLKALQQKAGMK